jgi:hypothetical protein
MSSPSTSTWTFVSFLVSIGVEESDADIAAAALLAAGYKTEKYLLSATSNYLEKAKVALPVIDVILGHQGEVERSKVPVPEDTLTQQQHPQNGKFISQIIA